MKLLRRRCNQLQAAFQSHHIPSLILLLFTASLLVGVSGEFDSLVSSCMKLLLNFEISVFLPDNMMLNRSYISSWQSQKCIYRLKIIVTSIAVQCSDPVVVETRQKKMGLLLFEG